MSSVKRQETRAREKDRLEHVVRGNRQDKEARGKGRRRSGKRQGKALSKVRQGKEQQSKVRGVSRTNLRLSEL